MHTVFCRTRQSAYHASHNTQTALPRVLDDIRRASDSRSVSILVLFEFSKALDHVQHEKLVKRFRLLNFSQHALH